MKLRPLPLLKRCYAELYRGRLSLTGKIRESRVVSENAEQKLRIEDRHMTYCEI